MKRFHRMLYFLREAIINISRNKGLNSMTIAMIAVSLTIFGIFLLIYLNLNSTIRQWSDAVQIVAYIDQDLSPDEQTQLDSHIRTIDSVDSVSFVSKEEALETLKTRLVGHEELLDGLETNPLPASFEIRLQPKYRNTEGVRAVVEQLERLPQFNDIQYGQQWLDNLTTIIRILKFLGVFLGVFLFLTVIFIVSNTIKLTLYSRKEELNIMKYIGATESFIKGPFLVEGVIRGFLGAVLSLLCLSLLYALFTTIIHYSSASLFQFASLSFLSRSALLGIIILGSVLGWCGSLLTLHKYLKTY